MKRSALLLLALLCGASGCGYHVSGHADLMPKTIKTVAVPAFTNTTVRYSLARLLSTDVTHEFISRTRYQVVTDPAQADAVLHGTLANYFAYPTIFDPQSGRATGVQIIVLLNITFTERTTGKVLYSVTGQEFRERYQISTDPQAYFDESGTAIERVAQDVARSVVSAILEKF